MNNVRVIEFAQYGATNVHPIVVVFMLCMVGLAIAARRSGVLFAVVSVCVFMPMEQRVVIGGLDFNMLRLIMVVAWARVFIKGEHRSFSLAKLDRVFLYWVLFASVIYVLRIGPGGIIYRLGVSFDVVTAYFMIRMLVQTPAQVLVLWKQLAWIVLALSPFLFYEFYTQHNPFGVFDYIGFDPVEVRNGKVRAQGPFSHPILAGTFGGVVTPVFVGIFRGSKKHRLLFGSACAGAAVIILSAGSSGPLIAWLVGVIGWLIWRYRRHTRSALRLTLVMAIVIHFAREKPVWHLIGRLSSITGGTGYHRYQLIDAFIRRFSEWALIGTSNTANWGWGLQDTTNQYVSEGIRGGFVTLVFFVVMLRISFVQLRRAREAFEHLAGPKSLWALLTWGSSVSLAAHCISFISVSYFGQMLPFFIFFIATVPAYSRIKQPKRAGRAKPRPAPVSARVPDPATG